MSWVFYFISIILGVFIILFCHANEIFSLSKDRVVASKTSIVEHLKISVPHNYREVWINAEKESWEPWLSRQKGFLGRQLFWNKETQEATLLITWESRSLWKSIPQNEIDDVQKLFEEVACSKIECVNRNPFPLLYEGELIPQ